jgi:hypothetical protein
VSPRTLQTALVQKETHVLISYNYGAIRHNFIIFGFKFSIRSSCFFSQQCISFGKKLKDDWESWIGNGVKGNYSLLF